MHRVITGGVDELDLTTVHTLERVLNRSVLGTAA
jgi:hypothetical protein